MPTVSTPLPIAFIGDLSDYRDGLSNYASGYWSEDRWKTFRLRFGIYAQRQAQSYMIRSKMPGGRLSFAQARTAALANRQYCGSDIHLTTRQDFQFYFLQLHTTPAFLETLYGGGITTREASGNTFRNVVACPLAGICPHELVDAGKVAENLSANWIRHPLVQHMPRKFKTTVSGCAHDCTTSAIDDLGFIATTKDGRPGFKVVAGGGLGNRPRAAVVVEEFIRIEDMAAVQETFARLHQGHSDRDNKNASRIKFLVDRYGEEGFVALFREHFAAIKNLPRRASVDVQWRTPGVEGSPPELSDGVISQHDGRIGIVVRPPLGMIDSSRLEALTDIAEELAAEEFRLTRDQNFLVVGLPKENRAAFISRVRALGLEAGVKGTLLSNLVSCPGTSTCTIGITDSNALANEILDDQSGFDGLPETAIRISGCHNSCGQHHIGDFGLHALAKKINGKSAPHYQFHVGGEGRRAQAFGVAGPVVPARLAQAALKKLIGAYSQTRNGTESVRQWVEKIGEDGLQDLLQEFTAGGYDPQQTSLLLDVGSDETFFPPVTATGECAASAVVGEYLSDLAETALLDISRQMTAGDRAAAIDAARDAVGFALKRILLIAEINHKDLDIIGLRTEFLRHFGGNPHVVSALNKFFEALANVQENDVSRTLEDAVRNWIDIAGNLAETLIPGVQPMTAPA
ncbi:MAG: nitrite/sulfite reductase [Rhodospirillales bacterium]|nr:nitrite/sulfite reductase [Rhodospirillales bacterium]